MEELKSFDDFVGESRTKNAVYVTDLKGMVTAALSNIYASVMAIAQELANEKAARNPQRYNGMVEEVDISRAMSMIFHSDWKKKIKQQTLQIAVKNSLERAGKQDDLIAKRNQQAIGRMTGDKDFKLDIDKTTVRFSDAGSGLGAGSNQ